MSNNKYICLKDLQDYKPSPLLKNTLLLLGYTVAVSTITISTYRAICRMQAPKKPKTLQEKTKIMANKIGKRLIAYSKDIKDKVDAIQETIHA